MKLKKLLIVNLIIILFFTGCKAKQSDAENLDGIGLTANNETITDSFEMDGFAENMEDINGGGDHTGYKDGFVFEYNNMAIYLGDYAENVLTKLGPALDFYEYREGCAADVKSVVKKYSYENFEITTYARNENDIERVTAIDLYDNGIVTPEGLYIGKTFEDMVAIYGTDYQEKLSFAKIYIYSKEGTLLSFGIKNEMIIDILYEVDNIEGLYK